MSWDDGKHTKVKGVKLTFDDVIRSIQVEYDGTTLQSQQRGTGGTKSDGFTLSPDEYITGVSGYCKTLSGNIITALEFKTNKKTYGPYGNKTQNYFSDEAPKDSQIAGFLGTSGDALNSINVHFAPISSITPKPLDPETDGSGTRPDKDDSIHVDPETDGSVRPESPDKDDSKDDDIYSKPDGPGKTGLVGGKSGDPFDDGHFDGVKKITVGADEYSIAYIKIEYVKDGKVVPLEHGAIRGELKEFSVDYPKENITAVGGSYDHIYTYDTTLITSLYFTTSNGFTSPLFGKTGGKDFNLKGENGEILVGFHGRSGTAINAIGVYFDTGSKSVDPETQPGSITQKTVDPETDGSGTEPDKDDSKDEDSDSKPDGSGKTRMVGGQSGDPFDDGRFDGVKKITVGADDYSVGYIKIEYVKGGKVVIREHGKIRKELKEFLVNYPKENITAVGGSYNHIYTYDTTLITSLYFTTSNGFTSPLFGKTCGKDFNLKGENGEILVGFHGRGGTAINAIGVYFDTSSKSVDPETQPVDGGLKPVGPGPNPGEDSNSGSGPSSGDDHDSVTKINLVGSGQGNDQINFDYLKSRQWDFGSKATMLRGKKQG